MDGVAGGIAAEGPALLGADCHQPPRKRRRCTMNAIERLAMASPATPIARPQRRPARPRFPLWGLLTRGTGSHLKRGRAFGTPGDRVCAAVHTPSDGRPWRVPRATICFARPRPRLGWRAVSNIVLIDEDLRTERCGAPRDRRGFQRLLADVAAGSRRAGTGSGDEPPGAQQPRLA